MNILITGASSGNGRSLAYAALNKGHRVWGIARDHDRLNEIARAFPDNAFKFTSCDLTDAPAVTRCFRDLEASGFHPDIVYLNAGIYKIGGQDFLDWSFIDKSIQINFNAKVHLLTLLGTGSRRPLEIILISSLFAKIPDALNPFYTAAKAGSSAAVKALRINERFRGIRLKTVYLGPINTKEDTPKKWYTPSPESTASYLLRQAGRRRMTLYYPWFSLPFYYFMMLVPAKLYTYIFDKFRRE